MPEESTEAGEEAGRQSEGNEGKENEMKLEEIQPLAESLLEQLRSACVRIEIAGSIRRRKPEPNDIELIAIPATGEYAIRNLFDEIIELRPVNYLDEVIGSLLAAGEWAFDAAIRRNGPHYKRLRHLQSDICCDLFVTDRRRWGLITTIRTGPGDFSKALMIHARRRGWFIKDGLLHKHLPDLDEHGEVMPCPSGDRCMRIIDTYEERDVFVALGLPWIEPEQRLSALPALTGKVWKNF